MHFEYYFCELNKPDLREFLDENRIRYKVLNEGKVFSDGRLVPVYLTFRIKGDSEIVKQLSQKYRCSVHPEVIYSADEVNSAPLLWMTPAKQVVDITNMDTAYLFSCEWMDSRGISRAYHKKQIGIFTIKKEPSSKTQTAIWAGSTGFAEVFVDRRVVRLCETEGFNGIRFERVKLSKGVDSENIFQLIGENVIDRSCIVLGKGEKEITCPFCGKIQYGISDAYQLHLNLNVENNVSDFYMTEDVFGHGIAAPLYLVSQRFFQALKRNGLTGNVRFDPVEVAPYEVFGE